MKKFLWGCLTGAVLVVLAFLPLTCHRHTVVDHSVVELSCEAPPFLHPGDKVALLSPSYATSMENVEGAAQVLRDWGFEPVVGPNVGKVYLGKYAGTPEQRLSDLRWALEDTTIRAIVCNRGGYGTIRYVDMLPLDELSAHPKWMVGFSDITTLHEMETRAGVMSIHGTMGSFLAKSEGDDFSSLLMRDMLTGLIPEYQVPAHPLNRYGQATGTLVGGNLCTFSPVLGTVADATAGKDIILFIEEVEENMSHIDRLINTLILNGVMGHCKGIVLGEFTDCEANLDFGSVEEMICSYLKDYDIPVCCGFPAGHGDVNLPLVMGAPVTMDVTEDGATLRFHMGGQTARINTAEASADSLVTAFNPLELAGDKQLRSVRLYNFLKHYRGRWLQ